MAAARTAQIGGRHARAALIAASLAVGLSACIQANPELPPPASPSLTREQLARLIFLRGPTDSGNVLSDRTQSILRHIAYLESLPFDGMVVDIPGGMQTMAGQPLDYELYFAGFLRPLRTAFRKFNHNFVRVQNHDPGDLFDDAAWTVTVENWGKLARATRDAGFVGIFFDDEEYWDPWLNYPEDYDRPTRSLGQYRAQARLRGRQVMEAIVAEFPDIRIIFSHGPYLSEPKTPQWLTRQTVNDASYYELLGPFFVGFVEGAGERAKVIDGGELYRYRTPDDFARSYSWRKYAIAGAEVNSEFVPAALRPVWPARVGISFGVFDRSWPDPVRDMMNPSILRATLAGAMRTADEYVWFYAERDEWLLPPGVSSEWIDAVRDARACMHGLHESAAHIE
ncbi:MAG: hypothetical protein ACREOF_09710 [Gemmatimonadales bacterium]